MRIKYIFSLLIFIIILGAGAYGEADPGRQPETAKREFMLGRMYYLGAGVERDYHKAREYFEIGAQNGDKDSQWALGYMYEAGLGARQNFQQAREWYEKSCANGSETGCAAYKHLLERQK